MLDFFFQAIQAPFKLTPEMVAAGSAALLTAAGGAFLSRKSLRKLRRKMLWAGIKERFRGARNNNRGGGCLTFLLAGLLILIVAIFAWKIALLLLVILLLVVLIKRLS